MLLHRSGAATCRAASVCDRYLGQISFERLDKDIVKDGVQIRTKIDPRPPRMNVSQMFGVSIGFL